MLGKLTTQKMANVFNFEWKLAKKSIRNPILHLLHLHSSDVRLAIYSCASFHFFPYRMDHKMGVLIESDVILYSWRGHPFTSRSWSPPRYSVPTSLDMTYDVSTGIFRIQAFYTMASKIHENIVHQFLCCSLFHSDLYIYIRFVPPIPLLYCFMRCIPSFFLTCWLWFRVFFQKQFLDWQSLWRSTAFLRVRLFRRVFAVCGLNRGVCACFVLGTRFSRKVPVAKYPPFSNSEINLENTENIKVEIIGISRQMIWHIVQHSNKRCSRLSEKLTIFLFRCELCR